MKVSVCMATYNGEKYIEEQLRSILCQLNDNDEIIISDDGSIDNTYKIINEINDQRIRFVINNSEKKGYSGNFQNALMLAKGDIIFLSDQDDVWLPEKYNKVIETMRKYDYDLVVTNSKVTDELLNITNESFFNIYNSGVGIIKNIFCCTYYGSCMTFNRKILDASLPFPKNSEVAIDLWLGLVAEVVGKVKFIDTPYILYRRSNESVTRIGNIFLRSKRPLYLKIYKRIVIFLTFSKFVMKSRLQLKSK